MQTTEEADVLGNSLPIAVVRTMSIGLTRAAAEMDKELLDGLRAAGMALRGCYYVDQGACAMIADGRIRVHLHLVGVSKHLVGKAGAHLGAEQLLKLPLFVGHQRRVARQVREKRQRSLAGRESLLHVHAKQANVGPDVDNKARVRELRDIVAVVARASCSPLGNPL
ncbi:hypothetical protein MY1884_003187 [Beauveria asiatica]